jgi:hypothetical protein
MGFRILAALFLLFAILLTFLATTGWPLTPIARIALKRAHLAPLEVSIESLRLRWRLPGTLRLSVREIRGEIRGGDPVAAVANASVDLSIGRLAGRRVMPSDVSISGLQLWLRSQRGGGFASPLAATANAAVSPVAKPGIAPGFTLSSLPASAWLRAGEETRVAIAGFQLHVLPVSPGTAVWNAPVLGLDGLLIGRSEGMAARIALLSESGERLIESETELSPRTETVAATLTVPRRSFREMLAFAPPGIVPVGVKLEGGAEFRLHARAQLSAGEIAADWEARVVSARLTLPALPKPLELPDTVFQGDAGLKGSMLETTARLAGGGTEPWAEIVLGGAVDLHSLKGTFSVKSPHVDLAQLAALMPQPGIVFASAAPLKFEAGADFDWLNRSAEKFRLQLDLAAGHAFANGRAVDWPAVNASIAGHAAAGFPDSEASVAASVKADFPTGALTTDSSADWDGKSGRLRVRSHSTPFDVNLVLGLVSRLPAGTAVSLPVSWNLDADFDTKSGLVRQAKAELDLGAGSLTAPEFLSAPLVTSPCRFAAEIADEGATGKIAPYDWSVGPVKIHSEGGGWTRTGDKLDGSFSLAVGRVKVADCVALLSEKLRSQLPKELAEVGDLALAGFDWHEHITGVWKDGQPVFDRTVADGRLNLAMGPEPLSVLAHIEMPVPPKTIHAEITIPDFVQARWRLPLLDRLPVPWLDAPARAQITADWEFPARLQSARWRVEAGAGRILPRGPLADWLGEPFPLTRFAVGGSVGPDFSHFEVGEFLLESGRARCQFSQFSLDLTPEADRRRLHVGGQIKLENWFAEDFLPLLSRPLRNRLPDHGTTLLDLGLQSFSASLDAAIAVDPSGNVTIESMKHDGSCVLRVGDQPLPLTTTAGYDPATHQVFARADIVDLRPAQFRPRLALGLPVPIATFDFPVSLQLEAHSSVPEGFPSTQLPPPDVRIAMRAGPGTLHRCDLLAVDTPLRSFELEAEASPADLTIKSFRAKADFGGPAVSVDSLRASFGKTLSAETAVRVADLPLDWLVARVPPGLLDPRARDLLPKLVVGGMVRSLDFAAGARLPPGKDARPEIVSLHFAGEIESPSVRLANGPSFAVGRIHFAGDAQTASLEMVDLQAGPCRVPRLLLTANQILGAAPTAAGSFTAAVRLGELPAFLQSLPTPVVLSQDLDWSKLAGDLTAQAAVTADLARLPDPAAMFVDAHVRVEGFCPPAIPGRIEMTPGVCAADLKFKDSVADLEGSLATGFRRGFDVIDGPVNVRFSAHGELAGSTEATVAVDLKEARLRATGLAWEKPAGIDASLQARVATPDFRCTGNAGSAVFELTGNGLVYQRIGIKGRVDARLTPGGPPAEVKLVCDSIEADATSLRLEAGAEWPKTIDIALSGSRLDLRPLIRIGAPQFAALNAPAKLPAAAVKAGGAAVPAVAASATTVQAAAAIASPKPMDLPAESKVKIDLQEIVLGGGRTIAPFALQAQFRGDQPVAGDLSFASLGHGVHASLRTGPEHPAQLPIAGGPTDLSNEAQASQPAVGERVSNAPAWSLEIGDVADLLAVGTAPLRELPAEMTTADTTIGGLVALPEKFIGGRLTADGTLDLGNVAGMVHGRVQVADLRLRTEIPFLSNIAGLVKKKVIITVPFKEFRIDSFTLGQNDAHVQNAFLAGPINFTAEKVDVDFVTTELFLRGKIIGVWFEVKGQPGHLEYYLADKNTALKFITTEDEFQW